MSLDSFLNGWNISSLAWLERDNITKRGRESIESAEMEWRKDN